MYRVQDRTMHCGCCWFDAHWNGREWHSDLLTRGVFNTLLFDSQVKRWRGLYLTAPAAREAGTTAEG